MVNFPGLCKYHKLIKESGLGVSWVPLVVVIDRILHVMIRKKCIVCLYFFCSSDSKLDSQCCMTLNQTIYLTPVFAVGNSVKSEVKKFLLIVALVMKRGRDRFHKANFNNHQD